jgi:hypothetical protein
VRGLPPCGACAAGDLALCQNFTGGRFSAGIHHGTCCDLSGGFATHIGLLVPGTSMLDLSRPSA